MASSLTASFIGYKSVEKEFTISPTARNVNVKNILLEEDSQVIDEIKVVGQRAQMRFEIDKKVFDVESNISQAGGSASELLENIPSVEVSLYDKEAKREVLEAGTVGNEIVVYEDIPKDYDAWNVESYYSRKHWKTLAKKPCMMTEAGEICAVLHTELSYESSVIEQDIAFFAHTRRIDFKTKIDWKEQQQLVKAEFHLDVMTRTAACEIPYGVMERPTHRNTSWQRAQFEMCAHRFVDLSEPGFGVALLNDGRYGHSIEDSFVSLTLLTSGVFPFPDADKGLHELTYALMPHMGDWREANVVHEAGKLNEKPILSVYKPSLLTEEKSSARYTMCEVSSPNVIVTSVKRAEDESGLIVRMYESSGIRTNVEWNLEGLCPKYIYECDMMEQKEREVVFDGQRAKFEIRPFEIKTFLLV